MRDVNEMLKQAEALILAGRGGIAVERLHEISKRCYEYQCLADGFMSSLEAETEQCAWVCDARAQELLDEIPGAGVCAEDGLRLMADTAKACAAAIRATRGRK
jgi:hypothetical protein